jgi:hypothetical protein
LITSILIFFHNSYLNTFLFVLDIKWELSIPLLLLKVYSLCSLLLPITFHHYKYHCLLWLQLWLFSYLTLIYVNIQLTIYCYPLLVILLLLLMFSQFHFDFFHPLLISFDIISSLFYFSIKHFLCIQQHLSKVIDSHLVVPLYVSLWVQFRHDVFIVWLMHVHLL